MSDDNDPIEDLIDADDPIGLIEKVGKLMQWVADHVPLWVIVVIGLLVAIFAPLLV